MPLFAVLAAVAGAEPPSGIARLELSPPEFPYHRAATLTVTAEAPADVEITLPDFSKIPEGIETQVFAPETLPAQQLRPARGNLRRPARGASCQKGFASYPETRD